MLDGAMKLHIHDFRGVFEDGVALIKEDGSRHHYVYLGCSIAARVKVSATVTTSNGTQQVAPQPSNVESWLSLAKNDKAVADALHFFRENTWISLYKVYEIIRADVGGKKAIITNGWATNGRLGQFTQTAQYARHASKELTPPKEGPMSIREGESLIRGILLSWFRSKA